MGRVTQISVSYKRCGEWTRYVGFLSFICFVFEYVVQQVVFFFVVVCFVIGYVVQQVVCVCMCVRACAVRACVRVLFCFCFSEASKNCTSGVSA